MGLGATGGKGAEWGGLRREERPKEQDRQGEEVREGDREKGKPE